MNETPLTREQVEALKPLATMERQIVHVGNDWVGIFSALAMAIDTDAALRAQLAEMTKRADRVERERFAQLAEMTKERDEVRLRRQEMIYATVRLEQEIETLTRRLAIIRTELERALREMGASV